VQKRPEFVSAFAKSSRFFCVHAASARTPIARMRMMLTILCMCLTNLFARAGKQNDPGKGRCCGTAGAPAADARGTGKR